jgi:hypothetical protein
MRKRELKIRKARIKAQDPDDDLSHTSPADRFKMVWPLTLNAWTFKEGRFAEPRLQRHLVSISRRAR